MSLRRALRLVVLVLPLALLGACDPAARQAAEAGRLLDADRALATASVRDGAAAAYFQAMTGDALQLPADSEAATGRETVRARLLKLAPRVLDWTPRRAQVSHDLDLGWTWGEWRIYTDAQRGTVLAQGKYLRVWKREGGIWQLAADIGNQPLPPEPAAE